jgi:tetratricopeptide (TPR) repeat protein
MVDIKNDDEAYDAFHESIEYEDAGNHEEALAIRKALVKFDPTRNRFLLVLGRSFENLGKLEEAEIFFRKAIRLYPDLELASKHLFHFFWDRGLTDEAFEEIKRFQSVSHSDDYMEIVREINEKYTD